MKLHSDKDFSNKNVETFMKCGRRKKWTYENASAVEFIWVTDGFYLDRIS
jgi:hypothetical protein